jgi:hypothetical protein
MKMFRGTSSFADFAPVYCWRLMLVLVICLKSIDTVGIAMEAATGQTNFPLSPF